MICDSESNSNTSLCREPEIVDLMQYEQLSKWLRRSCRSPFKLKIITPIVELMLRLRRDLMISTSGHRSGLCTETIHWDGLLGWLLQHLHKASIHTRKPRKAACWPIWCVFFESIIYLHLHSFTPPFAHIISISLRGCIVLHKHLPQICYLDGPGSAGSMNTQEQSAKVGKIWSESRHWMKVLSDSGQLSIAFASTSKSTARCWEQAFKAWQSRGICGTLSANNAWCGGLDSMQWWTLDGKPVWVKSSCSH